MYGPKGDEGPRGFKGATGPTGLQVQDMPHTFVCFFPDCDSEK